MPDEMGRPLIRGRSGGGSGLLEDPVLDPCAPVIGIMGTGDFSRSLARRLVASGYQVVVGSRTPSRFVALFPEEAEVTHTDTHTPFIISVLVFFPLEDNYIPLDVSHEGVITFAHYFS